MKLLEKIAAQLTPSTTQTTKAKNIIKEVSNTILKNLKKKNINARIIIGGSFAKQTYLPGEFDIDIFCAFHQQHANEDISTHLEKALLHYKIDRVHGSRDYFQFTHKEHFFEIIPVLDIHTIQEAQNVTDNSPLHVSWVKKHITTTLQQDIRLAKQFFKAQELYGAESYRSGYSGHTLDILIIHYGGFLKLLRATKQWKEKTIIDTNNYHKGKALHHLNTSKTQGPLIVIDPIDPYRNASAAVNHENFTRLKKVASTFLKKPTSTAFDKKRFSIQEHQKKKHLIIEASLSTGKEDVIGAKLYKAYQYLKKELKEFEVQQSGWHYEGPNSTAYLWFALHKKTLPETYEHEGPPLQYTTAVAAFKKKHKKTQKKGKHLIAIKKRKHTTIKSFIKEALKKHYLKEKAKNFTLLEPQQ